MNGNNLLNKPKKPHFNPIFHLKPWAGSDNKIQFYKHEHGKIISKRKLPQEIGYERNLYPSWIEENVMSPTDNDAACAMRDIVLQGLGKLNQHQRKSMAKYIMSL